MEITVCKLTIGTEDFVFGPLDIYNSMTLLTCNPGTSGFQKGCNYYLFS